MINIPESHIGQYIEKFGNTNQIDILQEEYAELIRDLSKFRKRWIERHQNLKKGEEPIK